MMDQGMERPARDALHDEYRQASRVANNAPSKHKAHAHTKAMLRRIHAAYCSGKRKLGDHLSLTYLNSMDARYVATLAAYKQLKSHERPNAECLFGIAQSLDPWNGAPEDVYLRFKPRREVRTGSARSWSSGSRTEPFSILCCRSFRRGVSDTPASMTGAGRMPRSPGSPDCLPAVMSVRSRPTSPTAIRASMGSRSLTICPFRRG
jgi:hypothetical protein